MPDLNNGSDLNELLDKSGQPGASPREYNKHQRYARFARVRHSQQELAFLAEIAAKLGGGAVTTAVVFAKIAKYGADQVKAATNISQLP